VTTAAATPSELKAVERYLHAHIPVTRAMKVAVMGIDSAGVRLSAPLAPNINHRNTAFGGSVATLAILSAWTLLHTRLRDASYPSRIVIQRNSMEYLRPLHGEFAAFCGAPEPHRWERFMAGLARRGLARIILHAEVFGDGELAGRFEGAYVARTGAEE
jgi:thioesterase domain-containing protein